jgi:hypothetical protein
VPPLPPAVSLAGFLGACPRQTLRSPGDSSLNTRFPAEIFLSSFPGSRVAPRLAPALHAAAAAQASRPLAFRAFATAAAPAAQDAMVSQAPVEKFRKVRTPPLLAGIARRWKRGQSLAVVAPPSEFALLGR